MTAPLESEADASALPEVRAIYALARENKPGWRQEWDRQCQAMIAEACDGVRLGEYERRIVLRLTDEPVACAAVAAVIRRARETGTTAREARMADGEAIRLLEEALHLRANGERAPGGNETWRDWDRKAERFLRARLDHLYPEVRDEKMAP